MAARRAVPKRTRGRPEMPFSLNFAQLRERSSTVRQRSICASSASRRSRASSSSSAALRLAPAARSACSMAVRKGSAWSWRMPPRNWRACWTNTAAAQAAHRRGPPGGGLAAAPALVRRGVRPQPARSCEAGLVARELLLRRKAKRIVVAAPPSVLEQWKTELEDRFGLLFEIRDPARNPRTR